MKNNGIIILIILFFLFYFLNSFTPLLADDYFSAFVWTAGVRINGILPDNINKISNFTDIYVTLKQYYLTWGGRLPGSIPVSFFIWQGKEFFNPFNAFMMTMLVAEVYWISHEGKVSLVFNSKLLNLFPIKIFFSFLLYIKQISIFSEIF